MVIEKMKLYKNANLLPRGPVRGFDLVGPMTAMLRYGSSLSLSVYVFKALSSLALHRGACL